MRKKTGSVDPIEQKLDAIHSLLQNLLIFEGAAAGLTMAQVRQIVGGDNNRISRVWKVIKSAGSE